jgi:hypothetical protein
MDAKMLDALIPVVAIVVTFGFPVALVAVWKWFKLKDKELQLDSDLRRTAGQALENRVQRLESIILALDADVRAKIGAGALRPELMEPPPAPRLVEQEEPDVEAPPVRTK